MGPAHVLLHPGIGFVVIFVRRPVRRLRLVSRLAAACLAFGPSAGHGEAVDFAFRQSLATAIAEHPEAGNYYARTDYADLWTGADDAARREGLFAALESAPVHGLPTARYDAALLRGLLAKAVTEGDRGRAEAALTLAYLAFSGDLAAGALVPGQVDSSIKRTPERPDEGLLLVRAATGGLGSLVRDLQPHFPQYARLLKEKITLEAAIAAGEFGPVIAAERLEPGDTGAALLALRDRLTVFGYLGRTATAEYDKDVTRAVTRFQTDNGLQADGVAGASTISALNVAPDKRLQSVIVALERLRWMDRDDLGPRHIWVNQPGFVAQVVDGGRVSFETRVVIGKPEHDTRSPEFSDLMEFMVINPSWSVPRSITTKEYLPMLRANPNAVGHLQVIDRNGRVVSRGAVNFAAYSAANFPFALRQAPGDGNALGKVKFMFPNEWNIYLHDTPSKSLFDHEVRAYSHGCVRVGRPFDLAYHLLAPQSEDPQGLFESHLTSGSETRLEFDAPIPVHLVYFTAWPNAKGVMTYRQDIYGRDAAIFEALKAAGLEQTAAGG